MNCLNHAYHIRGVYVENLDGETWITSIFGLVASFWSQNKCLVDFLLWPLRAVNLTIPNTACIYPRFTLYSAHDSQCRAQLSRFWHHFKRRAKVSVLISSSADHVRQITDESISGHRPSKFSTIAHPYSLSKIFKPYNSQPSLGSLTLQDPDLLVFHGSQSLVRKSWHLIGIQLLAQPPSGWGEEE